MNPAKFLPPRPVRALERERLMNKLLGWEDKKLVIMHAQAGQGKSTLAASYAAALGAPFLWYTMDRDDDNPEIFLSCFAEALRRTWPRHASTLQPAPTKSRFSMGAPQHGLEQWFTQAFGALPSSSLIVFDDYCNAPASPALSALLTLMIANMSTHVRFLVISRSRPELGLTRLRAARALGELTGEDLRFSDAEVQELFSFVFHMQLSQNEAALINAAAEGWPAGLVLMHEHLASLPPGERSLAITDRRAAGFRTHVFDYLAQEVFSHLPPDLRRFLLRTSIVDYLSPPLMELLTGLPASSPDKGASVASMVADLNRRNLFVASTGSEASLIRYHALFREFLRKKLTTQTKPVELKRLYTRAAAYLLDEGDVVRSIDLLLASGQFDRAAGQMELRGERLIAAGQAHTLLRWIEALPLEYGSRPWFLFFRALACKFTDPRTSLSFFELAHKGFRSAKKRPHGASGLMLSLCGIIEASFHSSGDFKRMARAAETARALLRRPTRESAGARARLLLAAGMAWFFIGKLKHGSEALKEALEQFRKQGDHYYLITSAVYLTPCALYQGDFPLARDAVRKGLEANNAIGDDSGGRAALMLVAAMTALFEGNFAEAQERIDACKGLADTHSLESMAFLSLDVGGWLRIAQGDYRGAELMLKECKRRGEESKNAFFSASSAHLLAIAFLFQGKLDQAKTESDYALSVQSRSGSALFHAIYLIASGAIHMKLGLHRRAEKELLASVAMLREMKAGQQEANARLVLAQLYGKMEKPDKALEHLRQGFSIGRTCGFRYYALFSAAELAEMARSAVSQGICVDYCSDLLTGGAAARTAPLLKACCLGGFKMYRGADLITDAQWKSKRAKTLLKMLAAQDNGRLTRDQAVELLWPDARPRSFRATFNSLLHRARKVLEPEAAQGADGSCIRLEEELIMLDRKRVWTDAGEFLTCLESARAMKASRKLDAALQEYEKAIRLYQGDFLPEELYSDWAAPMRDRLRMQYAKALREAADIAEATGRRDRTLAFHERLFFSDPCNETVCCWLMMRYHTDGRRNDAIRTYERCERSLSGELDLEPGDETRKVYRSIIGV